jgi:hypothetical protein
MDKAIRIGGTEDTPQIVLDKEGNEFAISGRSLPENAIKFYTPIQLWVEDYIKEPNASTEVIINFDYFNSSSVIQIFEILLKFQKISMMGKDVKVVWIYDKNDELMEAEGLEIKSVLDMPFELRSN